MGNIFWSWSSTSPANLIGGTWIQIKDTFLRPANSSNVIGGADTVKLTTNQIPAHSHNLWYKTGWGSGAGGNTGYYTYSTFTSLGNAWSATTNETGGASSQQYSCLHNLLLLKTYCLTSLKAVIDNELI